MNLLPIFSIALRTMPLAAIYLLGHRGHNLELSVTIGLAINAAQVATLITDIGISGRILNGCSNNKPGLNDIIIRVVIGVIITNFLLARQSISISYAAILLPIFLITITRDFIVFNRIILATFYEGMFYVLLFLFYVIHPHGPNVSISILLISIFCASLVFWAMYKLELLRLSKFSLMEPNKDDYSISLNRGLGALTNLADITLLSWFMIDALSISIYFSFKIILNIFSAISLYLIMRFDVVNSWWKATKLMNLLVQVLVSAVMVIYAVYFIFDGEIFGFEIFSLLLLSCFIGAGVCVISYTIQQPFIMQNGGNKKLFVMSLSSNLIAFMIYLLLIPFMGILGASIGLFTQNLIAQRWTTYIAKTIMNPIS